MTNLAGATCLIVPVYDHEHAIGATVESLKPFGLPCILVDDGSHEACAQVLREIAAREAAWVTLLRLPVNSGKGAAVIAGFEHAQASGFAYALQVDADGQHDVSAIPRLLAASRAAPQALITGLPEYDLSVPRGRKYGRWLTHVLVWVHTLSFRIRDSMLGFRVYPLDAALAVCRTQTVGRRMDFDTEIMVRMFWSGVEVIGVPVRVTYPLDGVSHFDMVGDNLRMTRLHVRLLGGMVLRLPRLLRRRKVAP